MTRSQRRRKAKISVCVPAYRAEAFIGAAIESVLAQTFEDWELIVLDNNSPDRTGEIARSYQDSRVRVERNERTLPLAENWNAVAAMAEGEYLKILCADDTLHPECLAEQAAVLDHHEDVAIVAARRDFLGPEGEVVLQDRGLDGLVGNFDSAWVVERVVRSGINPIGWPAALLLRRRDFIDVGAFDTQWLYPIDLELWFRILSKGRFYGLDRSLASFRISPQSASSTLGNQGGQHRDVLRAVASDPTWSLAPSSLRRGLALSYLEEVKKFLLFTAVNSKSQTLRRLPSMVLRPRPASRRWSAPKVLRRPAAPSEEEGMAARYPGTGTG